MIQSQLHRFHLVRRVKRWWQLQNLKLCFLIPASPNNNFFSQIAMFRLALNHLGGIYQKALIVVVFGDNEVKPLPRHWKPYLEGVITHWVSPIEFQKKGYLARVDARWLHIPSDCDFVIFADADVMLLRRIDDLLEGLIESRSVSGVIAHYPFTHFTGETPEQKWIALALQFIGIEMPLEHTYLFAKEDTVSSQRHCPFYLNFGFVIFPLEVAKQPCPTYLALRPRVAPHLQAPYYSGQVALTLAIYAYNVSRRAIAIKYNFPNDVIAETLYPNDLRDIRVIHYLRTHHFDRQKIFTSPEEFECFLRLGLSDSEKILQDHVRLLTGSRYPF